MKKIVEKSNGTENRSAQVDAPPSSALSPEMAAKLAEIRGKLALTFSQVTMALMATPRYRNLSIADLSWLVLEPLIRDRIAIASTGRKDALATGSAIGFAIWAKTSEEASRRIEEQIKAGSFPVRLKGEDWNSGEIVWLLDVVAPGQANASAVLEGFGQIAKGAPVRIHPMIKRLVDPELLAKLGKKPAASAKA
jgi:hemolysin-activating ACP:hemolysin acyltransferase